MKRAHPNDTLKVDFTSIPDSRNLRWPQNIGANGGRTPSVIENFEKNEHVLAIKYFHEIGKKWKNRKHFILTVLKVDLVNFFFFLDFLPFSWLFWRVLKKLFEKKMRTFWPPPKKYEIGKKYQKKQHFYSNNFENW